MRRILTAFGILIASACLVGAGAAYVAKQNTPARWLGWKADPRAGGPAGGAAAGARPTIDELLGFSRYLPADADTYISILQSGRVCRAIGESRAWHRLVDAPEIRQGLDKMDEVLGSDKVPPEGRTALELLSAAFDSEIAVATTPETSKSLLAFGRAAVLSVLLFAPSASPPDSPDGQALEEKRAPLRAEWAAALKGVHIPSFAMAARVRDEEKFNAFVQDMLDRGWKLGMTNLPADMPAPVRAALEGAYTRVTLGGVRLLRFRLRLGDLIPEEDFARGLKSLPIGEPEREALKSLVQGLTLDVHLGFLGEYLTLVVSSDDGLVRAIVDRYEGRVKDTLAGSKSFERIRRELTPDATGITFSDGAAVRQDVRRSFLPLVQQATDPALLALFGAPPQIAAMATRMRLDVESSLLTEPIRVEQVSSLDRGIRQFSRSEYEDVPVEDGAKPLATPTLVPVDAIGYSAMRSGSFEGLWNYVRFMIEQQKSMLDATAARMADNPQVAEMIRRQEQLLLGILTPIDKKLSPSLQGEMGLIVGAFAPFALHGNPDGPQIRDIPVPTGAVVVHSPAPDQAIEGFRDLLRGILAMIQPPSMNPFAQPPVALRKKDIDGIEAWALTINGFSADGLEPHLARVGDALVLSTSFQLTKQIRDTVAGKAPAIGTTATHKAMKDLLPAAAREASYVDGGALARNLRSTSDAVFAFFGKNRDMLRLSEQDAEVMTVVKRYVDIGLDLCGCLRAQASSTVREGRVDTMREWVRIEDLESK